MKTCPRCRREYSDETLNFCLDDGEWLREVSATDEPATAILSPGSPQSLPVAAPHTGSTNVGPKRKLFITIILAVVLVAAFGLGAFWLNRSHGTKQIDSIAVMPFINESGNQELEYLSDGMTESVIRSLSQLPNLKVMSRTSVFHYKGKEIDAQAVAKELNVQAVLTGTVTQRGDGLSISAELIDPQDNSQIWASSTAAEYLTYLRCRKK